MLLGAFSAAPNLASLPTVARNDRRNLLRHASLRGTCGPGDWKAAFGHSVLLAETFVESDRFAGTCYRAAGWSLVGETKGFGRSAGTYYEHVIAKRVLVRALHPRIATGRSEMADEQA